MSNYAVIPAYNEEKHLAEVIRKTKKYVDKIIVVDDGSKDNTYNIAKQEQKYEQEQKNEQERRNEQEQKQEKNENKKQIIVLKNIINLGKGAALRTGCDYALKLGAKNIVVLDADAQHDPHKIPQFLTALQEKDNKKDIVFGYRQHAETMPFILRFGNWFLNKITFVLYQINLKDTQCGYRAFTSEAYPKIRWLASDYSMETEMITKVGKQKLKYAEVPLQTIYLDKYKGTTVLDGMRIAVKMLFWKVN